MGAAAQLQIGTGAFDMSPGETFFMPVGYGTIDDWTANNDEADRQVTARVAGSFSKLSARVVVNTLSTAATTFRFRVNAGAVNQVVSFAAGATGWATDSSNSDAVADGD